MYTQFLTRHPIFSTTYSISNVVFLKNLKVGSIFHSVYNKFSKKSIYSRSAGTYCTLLSIDEIKNIFKVQLPSSCIITLDLNCCVVLGRNSNIWHSKEIVGKAGRNIIKGYKHSVRGVAMNPVDHPHGGRTKTNSPEKTPWGKVAKFKK